MDGAMKTTRGVTSATPTVQRSLTLETELWAKCPYFPAMVREVVEGRGSPENTLFGKKKAISFHWSPHPALEAVGYQSFCSHLSWASQKFSRFQKLAFPSAWFKRYWSVSGTTNFMWYAIYNVKIPTSLVYDKEDDPTKLWKGCVYSLSYDI